MNIEWRPVVGFEGLYSVSNDGQVYSHYRNKVMKAHDNGYGYLQVRLSQNGIKRTRKIHTLVATAFIGARPNGFQICHNNGNSTDNRLINLRYDSYENNQADRFKHGTDSCGEHNGNAKLTDNQIEEIRWLWSFNFKLREIAEHYRICITYVSMIVNNKYRQHKTPTTPTN